MRKYLLCFFLIISIFPKINAQQNDFEAGAYNVAFGAVFSSIGAIINKKPNEKVKDVLKNSLWQGAIGGYITFESKRILRGAATQDRWGLIWSAKIVNSIGTSIKENVSMRRSFYKYWHMNYGFNRFELSFDEKLKFSYKILPIALVNNISFMVDDQFKFDFKQSLRVGEFSYLEEGGFSTEYAAFASPGSIVFIDEYKDDILNTVHEQVHIFQSNEFSIINSYYYKNYKSLKLNIRKYNVLKLFYPDAHYLILYPLYFLEGVGDERDENFFEQEADYYEGITY